LLVLLAISITHFVPQLHVYKRWDMVAVLVRSVSSAAGLNGTGWGVIVLLAIPLLATALLFLAVSPTPIFYFLLALPVLVLTIGPGDLSRDVEHCIDVVCHTDGRHADHAVARLVHDCLHGDWSGQREMLVDAVFAAALQRWFAVLFWFIVAGPAGAVGYRTMRHLRDMQKDGEDLPPRWGPVLQMSCRAAQWPVAVLMTLALGVVASFDVVWHAWQDYYHRHPDRLKVLESGFLFAAVRDTFNLRAESDLLWRELGDHRQGLPPGCLRLEQSMNLVWRLMFVSLTVLGLLTVLGWVR